MSRRLRITAPPPGHGALLDWSRQITDAINILPGLSIESTATGPNVSLITGDPGVVLIDVGSSVTKLWIKVSGSTTTGWKYPVLSPIAYGDLPTGSGTWTTGSGTTVTFGGSVAVTSQLSVGALNGPLRGTTGLLGVDSTLTSNVYTPTRSAEANLDANVTPSEAQWLRVNNTINVSGRFTADPTAPATPTSFELTLPVASNIGAVEDLAGVAFCGAIAGQGAAILGSVANNTAVVQWVSGDVTAQAWSYTYSYQVI